MEILHLYISDGHNYVGHHGGPPGEHQAIEVDEVHCVAGRGIEGDRYFGHEDDFKGQITFLADEVVRDLRSQFAVQEFAPSVFRRNVITRGLELNELIGRESTHSAELRSAQLVDTESVEQLDTLSQTSETRRWLVTGKKLGRHGLERKHRRPGLPIRRNLHRSFEDLAMTEMQTVEGADRDDTAGHRRAGY